MSTLNLDAYAQMLKNAEKLQRNLEQFNNLEGEVNGFLKARDARLAFDINYLIAGGATVKTGTIEGRDKAQRINELLKDVRVRITETRNDLYAISNRAVEAMGGNERAITAINKSKTDWKVEHTGEALKTIRNEWVKIQDAEYN